MSNLQTEISIDNSNSLSNRYCICRSTECSSFMIYCDNCHEWYHGDCVGVDDVMADYIDLFYCENCTKNNAKLKTTYKRKMDSKNRGRSRRYGKKRKPNRRRIKKDDCDFENSKFSDESNTKNDFTKKEETEFCSSSHVLDDNKDADSMNGLKEKLGDINIKEVDNCDTNVVRNGHKDKKSLESFQSSYEGPDDLWNIEGDTSFRKAKALAYKNLKSSSLNIPLSSTVNENIEKRKATKEKRRSPTLRQCYGPGCVMAARKNSKYCSDKCGMKLAHNRLLEILPQRVIQRKLISCAADELSRKKLLNIRKEKLEIESKIKDIDMKVSELTSFIRKCKNSKGKYVLPLDCEDENSTVYCIVCGIEIATKAAVRHFENCYKRQDRRLLVTGPLSQPDDIEWSLFCNKKMARQTYCKKLRVLCPLHFKDSRSEDEVCGYPLKRSVDDNAEEFCGHPAKTCTKHLDWEILHRAQLDMDKLQLIIKLSELDEEEEDVRREMSARGDVLSLLFHQTIVHE